MTAPRRRRVLFRGGRHGDSVTVKIDAREDRVVVAYRDETGAERKRRYPNTREGRAEAVAFGQGWHAARQEILEARQRRETERPPLTVAALWDAFRASEFSDQVGEGLRFATQRSYSQHWRRFQIYVGGEREATSVTVQEIDEMRALERREGRALNQCHQTHNTVRIVFRWGIERGLIPHSPLAVMRWRSRKDAPRPLAPAAYTLEEFERLLAALDKNDTRQWKPWAFLVLTGHYGQRANAVLHLRWSDIDYANDQIVWPARYQKQGVSLVRPLLWEAHAALETARIQRERAATFRYRATFKSLRSSAQGLAAADWVFFAERDKSLPISYQSLHYHLKQAERRAGIEAQPFRSFHGLRRMLVTAVIEATGDRAAGLEAVGDRDIKMLSSYDRALDERVRRSLDAVSTTPEPSAKRPPDAGATTEPNKTGAVNH